MKFIKRKSIDSYKNTGSALYIDADGRATVNTTNTLRVPVGGNADRPSVGVPGMIRYNTDIHDFEVYTDYAGLKWEKLRTNRGAEVKVEQVGVGGGTGELDSISITSGGAGYATTPVVTISDPDIGDDLATVTVTLVGGIITQILLDNIGSGYIQVPTVTIEPPMTDAVTWTSATSVTNGTKLYTIDGNYYLVVTSGVTGATKPTHVTGTVTNGTAVLTFVAKQAVAKAVMVGTLSYELPNIPLDDQGVVNAKNIQVYVENVFQIPTYNYTVNVTNGVAHLVFDSPVPYDKPVYVISGYDK